MELGEVRDAHLGDDKRAFGSDAPEGLLRVVVTATGDIDTDLFGLWIAL